MHAGLLRAAERERLELIVVDNRYQPKVALRNAQHLIKEKVDLVIEFQTDEAVAPAIASKYLEAEIPLIAIDIPHPGATYFGANNYQAGLLGGRYLGQYAHTCWNGDVDEVLILELARAGALVGARSKGIVAGVKETLHLGDSVRMISLDGDGQFKASFEKVRRFIGMSKARHVLVGAANDPSALGAVRAFQETGREATCAVVGQNAEPDARQELRSARTPLVASVAYFPERYGAGLVRLALDILSRKAVPPAVFTRHQIITAENVDHFYPNDSLVGVTTAPRLPRTALRFATRNNAARAEILKTSQSSISSQSRPAPCFADQNYRSPRQGFDSASAPGVAWLKDTFARRRHV